VTFEGVTTGRFTYTPSAGYVGQDSFTFAVTDGIATSPAATEEATVAAPAGGGGSNGGGGGALPCLSLLALLSLLIGRRQRRSG
jgi:hypothetical protein